MHDTPTKQLQRRLLDLWSAGSSHRFEIFGSAGGKIGNPEPPIPVWITCHWKIFKAQSPAARLTISDWPLERDATPPFGQKQTFNFVEIEPYRK